MYNPDNWVVIKIGGDDPHYRVLAGWRWRCHCIWLIDKYRVFTNRLKRMGFKNVLTGDFLTEEFDMKFDNIVGNPPYQDGSQSGGQNKIYNMFSKKALDLLAPGGTLAFVTPVSVLKKSKRFSLIGQPGLKVVDFKADDFFDVGIKICYWVVQRGYNGSIAVTDNTGSRTEPKDAVIYDHSVVDISFVKRYEVLKDLTDRPDKRMFMQNAVNATKGRSQKKSTVFKYPVYKIVDGKPVLMQYNKPEPKFIGKNKLSISASKALTESAIYYGIEDFDVNHLYTEATDAEADNIKSFILSEYFLAHCDAWKKVDGYGFNNALKHLPPFDKTKAWTNEEVEAFIEGFV